MLCLFYCSFPPLPMIGFRPLVVWLISIGYSLTNKRKTLIFDNFRLFWAFFWLFLTHFSKMTEYNQFIFSGTLVHLNSFRVRPIRAFFDVWFAQKKFSTELNLPISGVQFSFATIFQYIDFVRFQAYSNFKVPYKGTSQW